MYAIVRIAGQQIQVRPEEFVEVPRLAAEVGSSIEFDEVLMLSSEEETHVGTPFVQGALVKAEIVDHDQSEKILVFHKKRRKGYKKKNGHRQPSSRIRVDSIQMS